LQAARTLANWLERRHQLGRDVFARGQPELLGTSVGLQHQIDVIEFLCAAMALFADGADDAEIAAVYRPPRLDLWTALDARERILQLLAQAPDDAPLDRFLPEIPIQAEIETPAPLPLRRRAAVASTLIAGLELARDGVVALHQPAPFATITLSACSGVMRHQLDAAVA
jgi:segregation and condensation protein A